MLSGGSIRAHLMKSWWGRYYIGAVGLAGSALVLAALWSLVWQPVGFSWILLAILTLLAGSFAIKIPGVPALIYVSEAFVFTIVLLHGAAPAIVTFALDGLLITLRRRSREGFRIAFNVAEPAISIAVASQVLGAWGLRPGTSGNVDTVVLPLAAMTAVYFLVNSGLNALAVSAETAERPDRVWRQHFLLLSVNCFAGASGALVLSNAPRLSPGALGVVIPILVVVYLAFRAAMGRVEDSNAHLKELNELYLSTLETLAMAIDAKDQVTHGHIRRVQKLALGVGRALGIREAKQLKALEAAALLHDMGKLGVPEHILNKPGKLTPSEYERMKQHAAIGGQILSTIRFPYPIAPIVRHHHESWDGSGYPDGLRGTDIPLGARIMAVVDCYDALTSDRPYRPALPPAEALELVLSRKGTMYDPVVVETFQRAHADLTREECTPTDSAVVASLIRRPFARAAAESPASCPYEPQVVDRLLALCDAAAQSGPHLAFSDFVDMLARRVRALLPADSVVFYLANTDEDTLTARHAVGAADAIVGHRVAMGEGISGWVAAERRTILGSDAALDLGPLAREGQPPLLTAASAPLVADGEAIGALTLYASANNAFGEEHREILEFVARQCAAAVARASRHERDRTLKLFDPASGLPNERYLRHTISSQKLADASLLASAGLVCVTLPPVLPADGGNPGTAIEGVTRAMKRALRATDLLFRTGEHELIVLIPDAEREPLQAVAARIRAAVATSGSFGPNAVAVAAVLGRDAAREEDLLEVVRRAPPVHPSETPPTVTPPQMFCPGTAVS